MLLVDPQANNISSSFSDLSIHVAPPPKFAYFFVLWEMTIVASINIFIIFLKNEANRTEHY